MEISSQHPPGGGLANMLFIGGLPCLDSCLHFSTFASHINLQHSYPRLGSASRGTHLNARLGQKPTLVRLSCGLIEESRHHTPRVTHSRHSANRPSLPWGLLPSQFFCLFPLNQAKAPWPPRSCSPIFPTAVWAITISNYNSSL